MRHSSRTPAGFTLLETILAVALAAVLMGLVAGGLQVYTQIVTERNADVNNAQLARAVLHQMTVDIRATIYEEPAEDESLAPEDGLGGFGDGLSEGGLSATPTDTGATSAGVTPTNSGTDASTGEGGASEASTDLTASTVASTPGLFGNQSELRIDVQGSFPHPLRYDSIIAAGGDPVVENLISVDRVVTYYLRPSSASELAGTPLESPSTDQSDQMMILVRRVQKRAEAEFEAASGGDMLQTGEQLLSDQVVGIEFAYHDGYDWMESWDSEEMAGLPIAVKVTVTIADPSDEDVVITESNIFQTTVAIPTAVLPDDTASSEGF